MRLSREFVDYMSKTIVKRLVDGEMIETTIPDSVALKIRDAFTEELTVEDRINEQVREYLTRYADDMQRTGASYQEMFKKIKAELVRREKVIL